MGSSPFLLLLQFLFSSFLLSSTPIQGNFLSCLISYQSSPSNPITNIIYAPYNSSYSSILQFSIQNRRFLSSTTPKPQFIIRPEHESHIQAAVVCSRQHGFQIRVRSGGHDYEGLSYIAKQPFVVVDLINLQNIKINVREKSAWVQTGANVGEVYYRIAEQSSTLAFSAGTCATLGVGGHFSGGGIGVIMRKYGLSVDNILDAYIVDVKGRLLDREAMGEDLFWAIRGGGGASFGVIVAWKIRLVPVPETVTVFAPTRTLAQGATVLVDKWQRIADKVHEDLFIRLLINPTSINGTATVSIKFQSLFLGNVNQLLPLMNKVFPELALEPKDCTEMSWINSTVSLGDFPAGTSTDVLLNRTQLEVPYFKSKSDFVQEPISIIGLENMWEKVIVESKPMMIWEPFGGINNKILESETPFPHRAGNMFVIQYYMEWHDKDGGIGASEKYLESVRRLYNFMTPYVSKSPRASYLGYRDLDLGMNHGTMTSYEEASVWGQRYFKNNFERLALVKRKVDPENFFWNEQTAPPLSLKLPQKSISGTEGQGLMM